MKLSLPRTVAIAATAALLLTGTTACNRGGDSATGSNPKAVLALSTLNNPFFVEVRDGALAAAKTANIQLDVVDAQNDSATQANQLANAQTAGAKAVIVNPVDSDAASASVSALTKANIPVVAVDRTVNGVTLSSLVASDNVAGGKQAAIELATALGNKGSIIVLQGVAGTSASRDRGAGFAEGMKAFPDIKIVAQQTANFDRTAALDVTTNLLQANPGVTGVFAENDEMALGAVQALGAKAGADVKVVGFDGTRDGLAAIKKGTLVATIAQQPAKLGQLAVEQIAKILKGEKVEAAVPVSVVTVNKANVGEFSK
ncbi:substrate-binding domain-containing protein [Pseudarthrobacter cellobiosi]|uniref:substrate-binding domain-containing protein n=1 Tax=Pseudarthrobacter cellobiosi TaxID=2953654 RepID=UPI00208F4EA1|nr:MULTISPECIES: substrate-binding domain-containing protein [unclassified Pseudarthrobacter]MCO4255018.1 substrate-binding domain-containing protein [Pseudarthrobacter sp. HLT1-5]MCO4273186.1 substrate-binding domain-containing protein [Pseudarthrobacter sp. HLT3-5]